MKSFQIKSKNVKIPEPELLEIENSCYHAFDRFNLFIREATLMLRDTNGIKGGIDKLCTIQLRLSPRGLAIVRGSGTTFTMAAQIACHKMRQVVAKRLCKRKTASTAHR